MSYSRSDDLSAQARRARVVAPSDSTDLPEGPARAIWVGATGDIALVLLDDTDPVIFTVASAPALIPFLVKRVRATGTTATAIRALY